METEGFAQGKAGTDSRQAKLDAIKQQVDAGTLVIRKMTPREQAAANARDRQKDLASRTRRVEELGRPADLSDLDTGSPFDRMLREQTNGHAPTNGHAEPTREEPYPDTAPWTDEQLDRLRQLWRDRGAASWGVSDALLEMVPVGSSQANSLSELVQKLSEALGAEPRTLRAYRNCTHCWPPTHRCEQATFGAHLNWTKGGPAKAPDRARELRRLAAEHGTVG
jgi:hypothetical protein